MQALSVALAARKLAAFPVLFRLPGLPRAVQDVYAIGADLAEVRELPWAHETPAAPFPPAQAFARALDLRDFAFDPAFRGVAMIDFFLGRLGVDPSAVPPAQRRNTWLAPRLGDLPQPPAPPGYLLVCPATSMALRTMPAPIHRAVIRWLRGETGLRVLTQGEAVEGAVAVPPRDGLRSLCALIAGARAVVSADTAMPHLADALGVPALTIFTTHRPEWRARDYPLSRAIHREVPGLPPALEFARSPEDETAAQAAWLRDGEDPNWLRDALASFWATLPSG